MKQTDSDLHRLMQSLQLPFHNIQLLSTAFTHSSYVNEHKKTNVHDNERLEFLGDAVLELTVSEFLYERYPELNEGALTKLRAQIVCEPSLMKFAERLDFGQYVRLGKGEEMGGGRLRPALLADVFEAFIGALYLDQGLQAARQFLENVVFPEFNHAQYLTEDYKTRLQEKVQQSSMSELEYRIVAETGPAHDRYFVSEVLLNGERLGLGEGRSKKESEQIAASQALQKI